MTVQAPKTTLQQRLARTYRIPNGVTYHRPHTNTLGGITFGEIVTCTKDGADWCAEGKGHEFMQAIALAHKEIERIQKAIDNMVAIMEQQDAEHDATAHLCAIAAAEAKTA
ncbi:hypothetical protein [uncultured Aquabacterium sp.]|uniref:hypothetical protein n=1 Tax=uncultured Aquabacterium sp. TaxID=158753 RepID=UPI0025E0FDBA|nr:hypothetical protein [uncultured Aquabacterium sp.]